MSVNLAKEASDGIRASALLNDPTYQDAVSKVRQGIIDKWSSSPVGDRDGQHELRLMLKLLTDIEKNIAEVATTGRLASLQIEEEAKRNSKLVELYQRGTSWLKNQA